MNELSPAEEERLYLLIEECGEVVQAATKILRHGYNSYHPERPLVTNKDELVNELHDLLATIEILEDAKDVRTNGVDLLHAVNRKIKWTHYQKDSYMTNG